MNLDSDINRQLRILLISFNMPWRGGGTFYRIMGFGRELVRQGHSVTVLATSPDRKWAFTQEEIDGVQVVLAPALLTGKLRTGWDPYEVLRRFIWLRSQAFDLIHGFESRPVVIFPALYARRRYQVPLILDWCDWFGRGGSVEERSGLERLLLRPVETIFEERFRGLAQGSTVINTPLRNRAIGLGVPDESIHWLPNGAEIDKLKVLDRAYSRQQLSLEPDTLMIGHLGQAFTGDAELMTDAFALVHQAEPRARLLLIGNHKTDIAAYAQDASAVMETGFVTEEEMNLYLAACDLLWLPLRSTVANRGRFPMKINDYMSSGRAVVATDVGDVGRLYSPPSPIGLLAEDSPQDFASKTLALLADPLASQEYGRSARQRAEDEFAWPLVTAELERFYRRIIGYN